MAKAEEHSVLLVDLKPWIRNQIGKVTPFIAVCCTSLPHNPDAHFINGAELAARDRSCTAAFLCCSLPQHLTVLIRGKRSSRPSSTSSSLIGQKVSPRLHFPPW